MAKITVQDIVFLLGFISVFILIVFMSITLDYMSLKDSLGIGGFIVLNIFAIPFAIFVMCCECCCDCNCCDNEWDCDSACCVFDGCCDCEFCCCECCDGEWGCNVLCCVINNCCSNSDCCYCCKDTCSKCGNCCKSNCSKCRHCCDNEDIDIIVYASSISPKTEQLNT